MSETQTMNQDDSETLRLGVGQSLEIAVGPTDARTGYVWLLRELPECVALECVWDTAPAVPQHGRLASRVFRVVGCHEGDGYVHCVLSPPWNPDESLEERRYRMIVSASPGACP